MKCRCECSCSELLKIPYGNPFRLCICRSNVAPGNPDNITFANIDDLHVYFSRIVGDIPVEHEVMEDGDIMLFGEAGIQCTTYGVLMTGTYNGHPWRWRARRVFSVVLFNADSSDEPSETFDVETYYIDDILDVEVSGDTMTFITHGHADMDDGDLILQETSGTTIEVQGDTLIITTKE